MNLADVLILEGVISFNFFLRGGKVDGTSSSGCFSKAYAETTPLFRFWGADSRITCKKSHTSWTAKFNLSSSEAW
jgi:hypothetical protein